MSKAILLIFSLALGVMVTTMRLQQWRKRRGDRAWTWRSWCVVALGVASYGWLALGVAMRFRAVDLLWFPVLVISAPGAFAAIDGLPLKHPRLALAALALGAGVLTLFMATGFVGSH